MTDHLSREKLLRYVDGELPRAEASAVMSHLESCWSCRSAVDRLETDIALILDAQTQIFEPTLPPPPRPWTSIKPRLLDKKTKFESSSIVRRIHFPIPHFQPVAGYATVALVAILIALLIVLPVAPVSATELVRNVAAAEARRMPTIPHQVVRQKVGVRKTMRKSSNVETSAFNSWKAGAAVYWQAGADPLVQDLLGRYGAEISTRALPLSADALRYWIASPGWKARVERGANGILDLEFTPVALAATATLEGINFQVQSKGWRVIQSTLTFADANFEIQEQDYSAIDQDKVPSPVLAALNLPLPLLPSLVSPAPPARAAVMLPNLNNVELDVRYELHKIGADLGEGIEVNHTSKEVVVSAFGVTDDRKAELKQLFGQVPHVELEFAPSGAPATGSERRIRILSNSDVATTRNEDNERLEKYFGGADIQENFTRDVLGISTDLLSHWYALQALAQRWPAAEISKLSPEQRNKLSQMVKEHLEGAQAERNRMQRGLDPILSAFHVPNLEGTGSQGKVVWQEGAIEGLKASKELDQALRGLLTTSDHPIDVGHGLPIIREQLGVVADVLNRVSN